MKLYRVAIRRQISMVRTTNLVVVAPDEDTIYRWFDSDPNNIEKVTFRKEEQFDDKVQTWSQSIVVSYEVRFSFFHRTLWKLWTILKRK